MLNIKSFQLPAPLSGNDPDTWTFYSIMVRLPEIIERILQENVYSEDIKTNLKVLRQEICSGEIRFLDDEEMGEDLWCQYISPYIGKNWREIPWFFAELYFYRRVLEATHYFDSKSPFYKQDPYTYQKNLGVEDGIHKLGKLLYPNKKKFDSVMTLEEIIKLNLWGNKADLSLWPSEKNSENSITLESLIDFDDFLLINHIEKVKKTFMEKKIYQIDILIDNTGFELICDLLFVDYIFENNLADKIVIHLKAYPIFVSDALIKDVTFLLDKLCSSNDLFIRGVGERLSKYNKCDRLLFEEEAFWTSPLPFWELPADLKSNLMKSDLIISKGDANYRRIHGDVDWQPDQKFENFYKPFVPFLILRVIKSDSIIGISKERFTKLNRDDPDWMKNGHWGLIQYVNWD